MSFSSSSYLLMFFLFSNGYLVPCVFSVPVPPPDSPYSKFIEFLVQKNCSMPKDIELPFPPSASDPFSYLFDPLKECQTSDAFSEIDEAKYLCREIFEVLQNITCNDYKTLPKIQAKPLSASNCTDFQRMKDIFPEESYYLSKKLVDATLCKILCSSEKYDDLCKTLLWSYDLLAKIKSALENSENEKVVFEKVTNNDAAKMGIPSATDSLNKEVDGEQNNKNEIPIDNNVGGSKQSSENGSNLSNPDLESSDKRTTNDAIKTPDKIDASANNNPGEKNVKSPISNETPANQKAATKTSDLTSSNKDLQPGTSLKEDLPTKSNDSNSNVPTTLKSSKGEPIVTITSDSDLVTKNSGNFMNKVPTEKANIGNSIAGDSQLSNNEKVENNLLTDSLSTTSSKPDVSPVSDDKNQKNTAGITEDNKEKQKNVNTKENSDTNTQSDGNSGDTAPHDAEANELSNDSFPGQENETKVKQTELKTTDDTKEKPKMTDFETPVGETSELGSKPLESTTLDLLPDKEEDTEHQEEKDQEQYNDTENENDYLKSEYGIENPPPKNKEGDRKSSDADVTNQNPNSYDDPFISSRSHIGRVPDDMPVISPFPEQEDSHFFFYFLSIVLILMAGYLIFHNKQKIIALIVEGRHERRRRSHGAGYKKLETK